MGKLHIARIRKHGDPNWFDPYTDIRKIIPQVMITVAMKMEDCYEGKPEQQYVLYIHNCIKVFQIRILEDKMPLTQQISEFFKALVSVPAAILNEWQSQVVSAMMCVYALFCRRDAVTDGDAMHSMLEYTRLALLKDSLSAETWAMVEKDLRSRGSLLVSNNTTNTSSAVCQETGEVIDNLKQIACQFMLCSENRDWDYLAELFDKGFNDSREKTDTEAMALALACPTYKYPTLMVEMDEPDSKAPEPPEK